MKSKMLFISKGMPNLIKSAGDIRAINMLKILRSEYDITVVASGADYGDGDVKGLGCKAYLGNEGIIKELMKERPKKVILAHWTVAKRFLHLVADSQVIIDTIDLEFLRQQRAAIFKKYEDWMIKRIEISKQEELAIYQKADKIIVVSESDKNELLVNGFKNIIELPCLFSVNNVYVVNSGQNCYTIGNWIHEPNITSTIYLCEKILPKIDSKLFIVGKHIPESITKFTSNRIIMHGAEYEIYKFLSKMNILLAPIFYGAGMNGKIGESLAFGIPVVTTTFGAKPYKLEHKKHAMIADNEGAFINSINQIIKNENLRKCLSINGKNLIKNYTKENWTEKFLRSIR